MSPFVYSFHTGDQKPIWKSTFKKSIHSKQSQEAQVHVPGREMQELVSLYCTFNWSRVKEVEVLGNLYTQRMLQINGTSLKKICMFFLCLCNTLTLWSTHLQAFFLWSSVPTLLKKIGLNLFTDWNCKYKSANYSNYEDDIFVLFWFNIFVVHTWELAKSIIQDAFILWTGMNGHPQSSLAYVVASCSITISSMKTVKFWNFILAKVGITVYIYLPSPVAYYVEGILMKTLCFTSVFCPKDFSRLSSFLGSWKMILTLACLPK
jgi:hypothetical protein